MLVEGSMFYNLFCAFFVDCIVVLNLLIRFIMFFLLPLNMNVITNKNVRIASFFLFVSCTILFELSSIYVMRTLDDDAIFFIFKILWSSLIGAQLFRVFFISLYTKVIYRRFIFLFALLSFALLIIGLVFTNGLIREGISGQELKIKYNLEEKSFLILDFSKYLLIELVLIFALNIHTLVVLYKFYLKTHSRMAIWILLAFLFIFITQIKLVMPFGFYFYIVHFAYLGLICSLIMVAFDNSLKYISLKDELKLKAIISETREETIHMIVHDLKVPLSVLKFIPASHSKEDIFICIDNVVATMENHIYDILDVYRHECSSFKICKEDCSFNLIVEKAIKSVTVFFEKKGISIICQFPKEYIVNVDESVIGRVIVNILFNSIKNTPCNGLIEIKLIESNNTSLLIAITDNGVGIESDMIKSIFGKFETMGNLDSSFNLSSGLGLKFCQVAVEAHGSNLELKSVISQGTTVSFSLDIVKVNLLVRTVEVIKGDEIDNNIMLTTFDVYNLSKYYKSFLKCSINEITDLRKIIKALNCDREVNQMWLKSLEHAVNTYNNVEYVKLVGMINPDLIR